MSDQTTTEERDELRRAAAATLDRRSPTAAARALLSDPTGHDADLWTEIAALGWLGLLVPERLGGAGAGLVEASIISEELGRRVVACPFLGSAILATSALVLGAEPSLQERWLPSLASGEAIGTAALTGAAGRLDPSLPGVVLRRDGTRVHLEGTAAFVPDAHVADVLVIAAHDGGGEPALAVVEQSTPGLTVVPTPTIDGTRRLATVQLADVTLDDTALIAGDVIGPVVERGVVVLAADGVGAAREVLDRAVAYAKERVQFGRPIGSFQAVKHMLANMFVRTEAASVAVEGAAEAIDGGAENASRLAEVAGSYARDAAVQVAGDAVQAHGGIGFTWEHDCHLFLKRTQLDAALLGDPSAHRERLAALMLAAAHEETTR
jgi:alkylation response protein AidB-like acyl-CoA dehydrogenase